MLAHIYQTERSHIQESPNINKTNVFQTKIVAVQDLSNSHLHRISIPENSKLNLSIIFRLINIGHVYVWYV
jgi:hypothetical protein